MISNLQVRDYGRKRSENETFRLWQGNPPYSGTCPVPLFSSSLTRLPPALMSSMARAWVMSRVLSPLISMIWSPTWRRHTEHRVDFCQPLFIHRKLTFLHNPQASACAYAANLHSATGDSVATKCLVQVHLNSSCWRLNWGLHSQWVHMLYLPNSPLP